MAMPSFIRSLICCRKSLLLTLSHRCFQQNGFLPSTTAGSLIHCRRFVGSSSENKKARKVFVMDDSFDRQFENVLKILLMQEPHLKDAMDWFRGVLMYNVPHGKKNRGKALVKAYKTLGANNPDLSLPENIEAAGYVGWALEMLQAYFLVLDDLMDQSLTRRGQPCWYKQANVGLIAVNDAELIQQGVYILLKNAIGSKPYYMDVVDLFHKTSWKTSLGQCMDVNVQGFEYCTLERYSAIVKYKTSYYSFCLSIHAAMYMAGLSDPSVHKTAEEILLEIGHFFQVQDDYLDCFGDPEVTGKEGTDIQDAKCAWPLVTALTLVSKEQLLVLKENYGRHDATCVQKVKAVYRDLDLPALYQAYEDHSYEKITAQIKNCADVLPPEVFMWFMEKIYKRKA